MTIRTKFGPTIHCSRPAATPAPLRSVADVAAFLGVSTRTVRRLIAGGDLLAHRIGRSLRISEADLSVYLARAH